MTATASKATETDWLYITSRHNIQPWGMGLLLVCLLLSIPIFTVFVSIFLPSEGIWQHLYRTVLSDYIINSLILMAGVGTCVLLIGVVPAWLVTMHRFPGSRIFEWALLLPLAMPAYIIAYTYTGMLDVSGPLQSWLRIYFGWQYGDYWFPEVRSLGGAVAMLSLVLYPYVYLLSRTAFIEQSICVLEVARTLGCGAYQVFFRIALPLARPAIIAGLTLVLMETLADYGTVQYFGVSAFTTGIFRAWYGLGSSTAAAQLSAVLLVFILVLVIVEDRSRQQARYFHTSTRYSRLPKINLRGWKKFMAFSLCVLPVLLGFAVPATQLFSWSLRTYTYMVDSGYFLLIRHSLELATVSSLITLALALFIAYGKRLNTNLLYRGTIRMLTLGYAVPGTVIAVGILIPFAWLDNRIDGWMKTYFDIATGLLLSGTLFALVFAYTVRFLPVSFNAVDAGLSKIKPSMEDAGRSMGLGSLKILQKIHMPIMRGSLLTAVLLVFVDVIKELPATLILRPFNFNTLAIRTFEMANEERLADAAPSALAIVLVSVIPVIVLSYSISRSRPGHD